MAEEPKIDIQQKETFEGLNYHNDKIGITIKLPQKWTVKETPLPLQDAIYLHPETLQAEDNINGIMIIRYKELTDIPDGAPPEIALDALVYDFRKFPGAVEIKNGTITKFKDLSAYKVNLMMQASEGEAFYFYKGGYEFTIYYSYKEKVIIKEILDSISFDATLTSPPQKQKYALSRLQKIHGMTLIKRSIYLYIIFYYLFSSFIIFIMSKKMNVGLAWLAWIPIAKEFLVFKLADISFKWMVLWLIPIILSFIPSLLLVGSFCLYILSISFFIIPWLRIIKSFNKSRWLIVPLCIPVIQLFVLGYLAFSKN